MVARFLRLLRTFLLSALILLAGILLLAGALHLRAPWYKFPAPVPFSGDHFYNPYSKMDSSQWLKANFHMHSHAWGGITSGRTNEDSAVWKVYSDLGFKCLSISNYQNINKINVDSSFYIPAYEHGYGIFKNHQLCLGARQVDWFDMPLRQTVHQKQYMIDRLHRTSHFVSINHPRFFGGYTPEDFSKLTGYDFIEVLNGFRNSEQHWDSALSAGRPAMLLADDDMHDLSNPREAARRFIVVNAPSNNREDVFAALKSGNAFGVYRIVPDDETWNSKKAWLDTLPVVRHVLVRNGSLLIGLSHEASEFRFYGRHGRLLAKTANSDHASYKFMPSDTYVRTVILFKTYNDPEGLQYFLNPVMRSADGQMPQMPQATIDARRTLTYRFIMLVSLVFVVANILILRKKFNQRKTAK